MPDFGFQPGGTLYAAYRAYNKVCRFETDCIKIFKNRATVHGRVYGLYGDFGTPAEFGLAYLNRRFLFTTEAGAKNWLLKNSAKEDG